MKAVSTDADKTYVCYRCIGDSSLSAEVKANGARKTCHFCGKRRTGIPLSRLADRIDDVMQQYYAPTLDAPGTEGYAIDPEIGWERRGTPVVHVIAEIADVNQSLASAIVDHLGDRHAYDAFEGGYENPYSSEVYYEERRVDDLDLRDRWAAFRSEIGSRARFFSPRARSDLDEIFGDVFSLRIWEGTPAVREIQPGD